MDRHGIPTLTTPRLVLRPFVPDDFEELAVLHAEESFWWYPLRGAMSKQETAGFLERVTARYESDGFGIEALLDRASGAMIGWAGLAVPHFLPEILPAVEVGWRLAGPWRGHGLATEAGAAALEFGFTVGGLDRIVSIYEPGVHPAPHHHGTARRGGCGQGAAAGSVGGAAWVTRRSAGGVLSRPCTRPCATGCAA